MNLNQIQTRIAELSAELLTLSNDMTFMLQGEVKRPEVVLFDWRNLQEGDLVHLQEHATAHGGRKLAPGVYKVEMVEGKRYDGYLPFSIIYDEENDCSCWVYLTDDEDSDYCGTGTNTHNLFRKVV